MTDQQKQAEQSASEVLGTRIEDLAGKLEIAREALEYLSDHHADGKECLCHAARSVVAAGLSLTEDSRS